MTGKLMRIDKSMTLSRTSRGLWIALERSDWALSEHWMVLDFSLVA